VVYAGNMRATTKRLLLLASVAVDTFSLTSVPATTTSPRVVSTTVVVSAE